MFFHLARFLIILDFAMMTKFFAMSNLIEAILVLLFMFNSTLRRELCNSMRDIRIFLLFVFFLWICIACFWGQAPLSDRVGEIVSWRKLILVPFAFVLFPLQKHKDLFLLTIVLVCLPYLIISFLGFFRFIHVIGEPSHLLENHTTQSILFSTCVIIICSYLTKNKLEINILNIALGCLGLVFFVNVILLNTSKTGFIYFISVTLIIALLNLQLRKSNFKPLLAFLVPVILLFTFSENLLTIFNESLLELQLLETSESSGSTSLRAIMWRNTWSLIEANTLFGTGSGSFRIGYSELVASAEGWGATITDDPHNQYLLIAAEQGLIGLLLFVVTIISFLTPLLASRAIIPAAIICGIIITSFFNGHFGTFVEGRFVWLFIGVFASGFCVPLPKIKSPFVAIK